MTECRIEGGVESAARVLLPSLPHPALSPTTSQCCRAVNVVQRYTLCRTTVHSHPVTCMLVHYNTSVVDVFSENRHAYLLRGLQL